MELCSCPVGCLAEASQHWSLQAVGWGQVFVSKRQPPGHLIQRVLSSISVTSVLVPTVNHSHPLLPQNTPRPAGRSALGSYEVAAFSLGPGAHKTLCALQEWSFYFPQSCGVLAIKPHWPSKPNALGAPPPNARPPDWRI